jgi:hypothetical protein
MHQYICGQNSATGFLPDALKGAFSGKTLTKPPILKKDPERALFGSPRGMP